jgi:uncharacterized protein (DUF1778 family)
MPNRKKDASQRPSCQRKRGNPRVKTRRGVAELYEHKKRKFNATLTPEAIKILEKIANLIGESRSQVIEKAMRGEIDILQMLKVLEQQEADTEEMQEVGA